MQTHDAQRKPTQNDDALDWLFVSFERRYGRRPTWNMAISQRVINWARRREVNLSELISRCPLRLRTTTPEMYILSLLRRSRDVNTIESFTRGLARHSEDRMRLRGGKPLSIGAVLRMAMRSEEK